MSLKDSIRKKTVGAKKHFRTTEIEHEGDKVLFKQLTQRERKDMIKRATNDEGNIDTVDMQIWAIIFMARDPETGDLVFDESDFNSLEEQPAGGFIEKFAEAAFSLMGESDPKDSAEA